MLYRYFADSYHLNVLVGYLLFGVADFLVADQLTPFVEDGTVLVLLSVSPPWQSKMKKNPYKHCFVYFIDRKFNNLLI